ncbi:transposase domain-containing protein [Clostridium sp.]|uniref:transposase domain-containing protein n=1 Tax=Clostridium sp. TaxID=1506 RepID=UPI002620116D|nr:transposase domain-containing protein [Clostridium sp.]
MFVFFNRSHNPYNYLTHLLENIPKHMSDTDLNFLQELLPWSASLPDKCRVKNVELKKVLGNQDFLFSRYLL